MQTRSSSAITPAEPIAVFELQQRVEVVADVDLVALQDHGRGAARDHGLQRVAAGDAAAEVVA